MKVIRIYASPHIFLTPQWATVPTMNIYSLLPSPQQGVFTTAAGLLLYALVRVIYNLYFHPLSRFPGPRGAACTRWWLAYMELGRGISLTTVRAELHKKYGTLFPCALLRSKP